MRSLIVYCSKTGNTAKVAQAIQRGMHGTADVLELDLTPEGILRHYEPGFTFDLSGYDLVFLGGWVMVMRTHPFLAAYINRIENIEGRNVVGFFTGGSIFSRGHVIDDFTSMIERRGARVVDCLYLTTLLGPLLTKSKLRKAETFARDIMAKLG